MELLRLQLTFLIGADRIPEAVALLRDHHKLTEASVVAAAAFEGRFCSNGASGESPRDSRADGGASRGYFSRASTDTGTALVDGLDSQSRLFRELAEERARKFFGLAQPVKAAAALLTVNPSLVLACMNTVLFGYCACCPCQTDSVDSAVAVLLKAGEVELAYALAIAGKADNPDVATLALCRKCEALGFEDLAVALLSTMKDAQIHVNHSFRVSKTAACVRAPINFCRVVGQKMLFAARSRSDPPAIEALHSKLGLRSRRAYSDDAVHAVKDAKRDVLPAISCFTLAGQHSDAARLAVSELEGEKHR
jgi:hypothetical protein